jgi:hypothetical protein
VVDTLRHAEPRVRRVARRAHGRAGEHDPGSSPPCYVAGWHFVFLSAFVDSYR